MKILERNDFYCWYAEIRYYTFRSIVANPDIVQTGGELGSFKNMVQFDITTFAKGDKTQIVSYLNKYMQKMKFLLKEKKFLVDKLPFNIFLIGFIIKLLPGAKIILMNRSLGLMLSRYTRNLYR